MNGSPYWIDNNDNGLLFPPTELALEDPNGLLAVGGDLQPERLIEAYRQGIFPWYSNNQPILWWSPNPRAVLFPEQIKVSRSLKKTIKRAPYTITIDKDFAGVVQGCSEPRKDSDDTWITSAMQAAYIQLHRLGVAHSVETWLGDTLVGGLYGLAIGRVFFGESMFSRATNASKIAFVHLVKQLEIWDYRLIDCQVSSEHISSLGSIDIPRQQFQKLLNELINKQPRTHSWAFDKNFSLAPPKDNLMP
jgi:leucyl/phenylalanyl-tRNA--protein transferase